MNQINICIVKLSATSIGVGAIFKSKDDGIGNNNTDQISVMSHSLSKSAIENIKQALISISKQRSDLGAIQNRLEHTVKNLDTTRENTQAAESLIRDTDMASTMVEYSKNNILAQAGQSMLAQANQSNQGVLSLLG
jgi:flagellin